MGRGRRFSAGEVEALRRWLDGLYAKYHRRDYIGSDPVQFLHKYADPADQEVVGLIAASLAYGNVTSINRSIDAVLLRMDGGMSPSRFLMHRDESGIRAAMEGFRHRWTGQQEMSDLLIGMRRALREAGRLGLSFQSLDRGDSDWLTLIGRWVRFLQRDRTVRAKELLSDPGLGSACKRLHLYFRWMVRKDAIDPGCWAGMAADRLVMPLDTHIYSFARAYRFTLRSTPDGKAAQEITDVFRRVYPSDPVKYDFALTRPGIIDGWRPGSRPPWFAS